MPFTSPFGTFMRSVPRLGRCVYHSSAPLRSAIAEVATDVARQTAQQEFEAVVCGVLSAPGFPSPTKRNATTLVQAVRGRFVARQGLAKAAGVPVAGFVVGQGRSALARLHCREYDYVGVRVLAMNMLTFSERQSSNLQRQPALFLRGGVCTMSASLDGRYILPWVLQQLGWLAQESLDETIDGNEE